MSAMSGGFFALARLSDYRLLALFKSALEIGWAVHHRAIPKEELIKRLTSATKENGTFKQFGRGTVEAIIDC